MRGSFVVETQPQTRLNRPAPKWAVKLKVLRLKTLTVLTGGLALCTAPLSLPADANAAALAGEPVVSEVLHQQHHCSSSLILRHARLQSAQLTQICTDLAALEQRFHQLLQTGHKPVAHDGNTSLRANIFASKADYQRFAGPHFSMPTDNGGMYLEGIPDRPGNQAEFVAYQRENGEVWNLQHEFIHYLDGRFNLYGDFCANLHDSHAAPENCPKPAPQTPYLVWWTEGLAEYIAHGADNPAALALAATPQFTLSALFNTGYEQNGGSERVYRWGYLASRYLIEQHPAKTSQLLQFWRAGDYPRYQALVKSWGTSLDAGFKQWLASVAQQKVVQTKVAPLKP
ncbi:MAG: collagenase [Rheinheimera sp.]|nr:collagenase [Rheinheimera sp.]